MAAASVGEDVVALPGPQKDSSWVVATSWTGVTVATLLAVFVWDRRRRARAEAPAVARERTPVAA